MKFTKLASATLLSLAAVSVSQAVTLDIEITNLTQAQSFTPRLVIAHDDTVDAFEVGQPASSALAWLAEAVLLTTNKMLIQVAQTLKRYSALLIPTMVQIRGTVLADFSRRKLR